VESVREQAAVEQLQAHTQEAVQAARAEVEQEVQRVEEQCSSLQHRVQVRGPSGALRRGSA